MPNRRKEDFSIPKELDSSDKKNAQTSSHGDKSSFSIERVSLVPQESVLSGTKLLQEDDSLSSDSDHWVDPLLYNTPPAEYWHAQKMIKYIKAGNQTATVIALSYLRDFDLSNEFVKLAIRDIGGLEVLINLLETQDYHCIFGALNVLNEIADHRVICRDLINLGIVPITIKLLQINSRKTQNRSAHLISKIAEVKKAKKLVYDFGGLPLLVDLCDLPEKPLQTPEEYLTKDEKDEIKTCVASAKALYSLSQSRTVKKVLIQQGILRMISRLLNSIHDKIVLYTMGFFQNCATEDKCQLAIETEDIIQGIIHNLLSKTAKLRELCSQAIFKSCEKEGPRKLVYYHGGCKLLVELLKDKETESNTALLIAVSGAIWKCSLYEKNLLHLDSLGALKVLLRHIKHLEEELVVNVMGAIAEMVKIPASRKLVRNEGAIPVFVSYLNYTNNYLLINVVRILKECAYDEDCLQDLENLDALRFVWSLLKNKHPGVESNAAFAIVPFIINAQDSGETVRSLVGGLELLVDRLKSNNEIVVAGVCAAIATVAKDRENLAVISEHGVIKLLAQHINTKNQLLRQHLSSAIAECCWWQGNCHIFGQLGICARIVDFFKTENIKVKVTAAQAMCALSYDPINCIILHQNGIVPLLIDAISSKDKDLEVAAAGCLENIRLLALKADEMKNGCARPIYKEVQKLRRSLESKHKPNEEK